MPFTSKSAFTWICKHGLSLIFSLVTLGLGIWAWPGIQALLGMVQK